MGAYDTTYTYPTGETLLVTSVRNAYDLIMDAMSRSGYVYNITDATFYSALYDRCEQAESSTALVKAVIQKNIRLSSICQHEI